MLRTEIAFIASSLLPVGAYIGIRTRTEDRGAGAARQRVGGSRYGLRVTKSTTVLACSDCRQQVSRWVGRCPGCGGWGTIEE
jgi:lipopolysaccharide biosynthesis regulator YciM